MMAYRDPTCDIDQMRSTTRHLYLDDLSRSNGAKGKIAGRGVAMTAGTTTCTHCGQDGHLIRKCWKKQDEYKQSGGDRNHHNNQRKERKLVERRADAKQDPKAPPDRSGVLFTKPPLTATTFGMHRVHHDRSVGVPISLLLHCLLILLLPTTTTMHHPSNLMMTSTRGLHV